MVKRVRVLVKELLPLTTNEQFQNTYIASCVFCSYRDNWSQVCWQIPGLFRTIRKEYLIQPKKFVPICWFQKLLILHTFSTEFFLCCFFQRVRFNKTVLPKLNYKLSAVPVKIPVGFWMTLTNSFEKLSERTKQENLPNQILLLYLKDEVVRKKKGDIGIRKDRDQWNGIGSSIKPK